MNKKELNWFIDALQRQRALLVGEVGNLETDLQLNVEDREPELEERAQKENMARILVRLDEQGKHEIEEICAALRRIAEGAYGICEGCGESIAEARLRALPSTRFCVDCARQQETARPAIVPEEEARHSGRVRPDLSLFSDRELEEYLREQVREDGRVDTDELRLVCRHGVTYLEGALPSKAEHSILLQLLTDVMGIEEIVDHLPVKELLWEREDRSKTEPAAEQRRGVEPSDTEDIVESLEEGVDYVPSMKPTPEED